MAGNHPPAPGPKIAQGGLVLMLCEAILHVLVEQHVLEKEHAIDAIDGVADIIAGFAEADGGNIHTQRDLLTLSECAAILNSMRESFEAHD
jgi:hypothetical protein